MKGVIFVKRTFGPYWGERRYKIKDASYDPGEGDLLFKACRYCTSEWCDECEYYNQNHCKQDHSKPESILKKIFK